MNIPEDLRYSSDHEWVRVDGDVITIGITDFAQDNLGDVVFFDIPEVGDEVEAGSAFSEIESTKSVSDIYSPVSGTIQAVNTRLEEEPQLVNSQPYGDGWLVAINISNPSELDGLMDAAAYAALISD